MIHFNEESKRNYTFVTTMFKNVRINQSFLKQDSSVKYQHNNFSFCKDLTKKNFNFLDF